MLPRLHLLSALRAVLRLDVLEGPGLAVGRVGLPRGSCRLLRPQSIQLPCPLEVVHLLHHSLWHVHGKESVPRLHRLSALLARGNNLGSVVDLARLSKAGLCATLDECDLFGVERVRGRVPHSGHTDVLCVIQVQHDRSGRLGLLVRDDGRHALLQLLQTVQTSHYICRHCDDLWLLVRTIDRRPHAACRVERLLTHCLLLGEKFSVLEPPLLFCLEVILQLHNPLVPLHRALILGIPSRRLLLHQLLVGLLL
mmetsp:Transcript_34614/g.67795  ORF Transcript_34614/g.67795 Transcript_34614/m.67795 type:complete len:253 (+) Transcript_34614:539-1297(+)